MMNDINDILERLQVIYIDSSCIRIVVRFALILGGMLLLWWSGGFPPWAWRFLFQVIPQVPRLWAVYGWLMVMPLAGLLVLSVLLLAAWVAFILVSMRLIRSWWQERQELRRFNEEVIEARNLAEVNQETQQHSNSCPKQPVHASTEPSVNSSNSATSGEFPAMFPLSVPESQSDVEEIASIYTPVLAGDHVKTRDDGSTGGELLLPAYFRNVRAAPRLYRDGRTGNKRERYLDIGTGLDAGTARRGRPNEDSLFAIENITNPATSPQPTGLFIVADGMGGHGNGKEASQLAIRAMRESVLGHLHAEVKEDEMIEEILVEGVQHANYSVHKRNQQQSTNMGTTMTAALLWGTTVYVVNVGDSRTYLYRTSEGLYQITQDHSVVARLVEMGAITADEAYTHPKRNTILRALGNDPTVDVDCFTVQVRVGDVLLLCSDGLWEMVRDFEIQEIVHTSAPYASRMCALLILAALNRGGKDNISVIAVCVRED
jgi:serine/threonine protein phosphatase PrpC